VRLARTEISALSVQRASTVYERRRCEKPRRFPRPGGVFLGRHVWRGDIAAHPERGRAATAKAPAEGEKVHLRWSRKDAQHAGHRYRDRNYDQRHDGEHGRGTFSEKG
jgi:hypothetical protein